MKLGQKFFEEEILELRKRLDYSQKRNQALSECLEWAMSAGSFSDSEKVERVTRILWGENDER